MGGGAGTTRTCDIPAMSWTSWTERQRHDIVIDIIQPVGYDPVKGYVENLTLGWERHYGTGNVADNTLTGNSGANTLSGAGNDTLVGEPATITSQGVSAPITFSSTPG